MSYVLVDEQGNAHDLATNAGLEELYTLAQEKGANALLSMLERGDSTPSERVDILMELEGKDDFKAAAEALRGLTGRVVVSNGVVEEED